MARILSIDYGQKRTGIAATDPLQIIANGVTTVPSGEIIEFLNTYMQTEQVETIVVGMPKQLNNEPSENMRYIEPFVRKLKATFPDIPVLYFDELFTYTLAHLTMLAGGMKKKERQNKAKVDEISAVIILQGYLESKKQHL